MHLYKILMKTKMTKFAVCVQHETPLTSLSKFLASLIFVTFFSQIYLFNCYFPVPYLMLLLKCQQITRFDLPIFSCSMQALTSNLIHCIISTIASGKVICRSTSPSSSILTAEFQTQILNCLLYRMYFKRI